jgi:hypothetical protein
MEKIWDCIHIFGKTIGNDQDSRIAFHCFINCLIDLLPFQDYKYTIQNYLNSHSITGDLFEWSYKLHYWCNYNMRKPLFTYFQLQEKYRDITMDEWSDAVWFIIHFIPCNLPEKLNNELVDTFKSFMMCLRYLLPCPKCKGHMEQYLFDNEIRSNTNFELFSWTFFYHKNVDKFSPSGKNSLKSDNQQDLFNFYKISRQEYSLIDN